MALKHNSIVTMPTMECLQMFTEDIGMVAHDWSLGEEISCEEMHCQVGFVFNDKLNLLNTDFS